MQQQHHKWEVKQRVFMNHPQESWIVGHIEKVIENAKDPTKTKYQCVPQDQMIKVILLK
jgi:hypothetical protein